MTSPVYRLDDRVRHGIWWLTGLALMPLLAQALLVAFAAPPVTYIALASQVLYGALMLTFIGAVHVGLLLIGGAAFSRMQIVVRLIWSAIPACFAFVVAQLTYPRPLLWLAGALLVSLLVDWRLYGGAAPVRTTGFLPMRLVFTVVAVLCLLATWAQA